MPTPKKPLGVLQNTRSARVEGRSVALVARDDPAPPAAPAGWLKGTVGRWDTYWRSDVSQATVPADFHVVERYFGYLDEFD
ncbi:MAG: hypothetical protein H0U89_10755, partial [Acidimicrobiia bacterium]|nr:hypothetical protein [Acidimicrobiia bacterium]